MAREHGKRAVALVSGGLDSVVSLAVAARELEVRLVLFVDYGQRAREREREASMAAANFFGLPFREVALPWLGALAPEGMQAAVEADPTMALDTLGAVWVPNRNGVLLNVAAAYAESYDCGTVVTGFNREEAEDFPDNRAEYVERVNRGFELSTRNALRVTSFTQELDKAAIVELGLRLGVPFSVVWSCYHGRERMCGRCASCRRFKSAMEAVAGDKRPPVAFED